MGYVEENLLAVNERMIRQNHRHVLSLVPAAVRGLLWIIAGIVLGIFLDKFLNPENGPASAFGWISWASPLFFGAIGALLFGYAWLRWTTDVVVLTERRLIHVQGILNKSAFDSSLIKINDMQLRHSIWGRMFGYADLDVLTAAEESANPEQVMRMLAGAAELKRDLLNAKDDLEKGAYDNS